MPHKERSVMKRLHCLKPFTSWGDVLVPRLFTRTMWAVIIAQHCPGHKLSRQLKWVGLRRDPLEPKRPPSNLREVKVGVLRLITSVVRKQLDWQRHMPLYPCLSNPKTKDDFVSWSVYLLINGNVKIYCYGSLEFCPCWSYSHCSNRSKSTTSWALRSEARVISLCRTLAYRTPWLKYIR